MSKTICHHYAENESRCLYKIPVQRENIICVRMFSVPVVRSAVNFYYKKPYDISQSKTPKDKFDVFKRQPFDGELV